MSTMNQCLSSALSQRSSWHQETRKYPLGSLSSLGLQMGEGDGRWLYKKINDSAGWSLLRAKGPVPIVSVRGWLADGVRAVTNVLASVLGDFIYYRINPTGIQWWEWFLGTRWSEHLERGGETWAGLNYTVIFLSSNESRLSWNPEHAFSGAGGSRSLQLQCPSGWNFSELVKMCEVCPAGKHSSICLPPIALIKYTFLLSVSFSQDSQNSGTSLQKWNHSSQYGNYTERGKYLWSPFSHWSWGFEARGDWGLAEMWRGKTILEKIFCCFWITFLLWFFCHLHRIQLDSCRRLQDLEFSSRNLEVRVNIVHILRTHYGCKPYSKDYFI